MCFENKVVFITGANGGLAKSFIEALLKENAKKIYCTARDLEKLAELKKLSSKIEIFNLDITKKDELEVEYDMNFIKDKNLGSSSNGSKGAKNISDEDIVLDDLYEDAKEVIITDKKTSISYLQRRLKIGYNRAATIIEQLEKTGVLSEVDVRGNREILVQ